MTASQIRQILIANDFGIGSPYQYQLRRALSACTLPVSPLISDLAPFQVEAAAYLLPRLIECEDLGTLVLAVVDPGVGGPRNILLVVTPSGCWVGPDNGLLSRVAAAGQARCFRIGWRPERASRTFEARDVMAPAIVRWIQGADLQLIPVDRTLIVGGQWPEMSAKVVYIDHFGNLITGLPADYSLNRLRIKDQWIPVADTFSEVAPGKPVLFRDSWGLWEIAINQGSAKDRFSARVGERLHIVAD